ncbi:MAG: PAS domain S-box protein [Thermoanaerobaculia bacterium]
MAESPKPPVIERSQPEVSERRAREEAERALRESEQRYRALVETCSDWVWEVNAEGTYTYVSARAADFLGYSADEVLGRTPFDLMPEDESRRVGEIFGAIAAERKPFKGLVNVNLHKNGQRVVLETSGVPVFGPGGDFRGYRGTDRDITVPTRAEEALQASEARYRVLFENAIEGIIAVDPATGRLRFFNPAVCAMFGYTAEEFRDLRLPDLHPAGALQPVRADIEAVARGKGGDYRIVPCLRKDGTLFQADISGSTAELDGKRLVFGFFTDVTERIRAEEALRESEARYRRIVETANEGIWSVDADLRTTFVNDTFARMLGYAPEEMIGTLAEQFTFPENLDEFRIHMDARRRGQAEQYERRFRRKDGIECWCFVSGTPILDSEGRFAGSFGMLTDITKRRHLEEQLRQSQKMEAVGLLAGGVAHDFNNLLTVITGNSELLLGQMTADDPFRVNLADIRHAGERAAALTRQLLAFSRKQILEPRILDLNDVVAGTEKLLRRLIGEDIVLTCILDQNLHRVTIDPSQMEQVILNIAVNARDAMPRGGRLTIETRNVEGTAAPSVDTGPGKIPRFVLLAISDTGCGMTPEIRSRVFEPFFTTKSPAKGTGLGLATVYGIVQQSGGHIDLRSVPGEGSRFEILLPAVEETPAARVSSDARLRAVPKGTETILLVEDEEAVRRIIRLVLDASGYKVLEASNGEEALEIAHGLGGAIHLVVTDVVMPEMSGRELAERLRSQAPFLRVLFVSGYTDDAVIRHGVVDGRESFLQKPFSPLTLAKKVREALDAERSPVG